MPVSQRLQRFAWFAMLLAGLCLLLELLAGPAYRLEWLALKPALQTLRWAATVAAVVLVLALLLRLLARNRLSAQARRQYLVAGLVCLLAVAPPGYLLLQAIQLPRIHEVSTDTQDPPGFVALLEQRKSAPNGLLYGAEVAAQQKAAYPDLLPLLLPVPADQAFARALRVAAAMGWSGVTADGAALRIEATATTLLFGFKDDVVIRIRPEGQGSRVDVRSASRVGLSDIGANAARVRAFLHKLQAAP